MTTARLPTSTLVHGAARPSLHRLLLRCGVVSSLVYVLANVVGALCWSDYSSTSQTVSELYAIGAPSRFCVLPIGLAFDVLLAAFAVGVWRSAHGKRGLRTAAAMLFAVGAIGPLWPPMHLRGANVSLTDTLHVVVAGIVVAANLLAMAFGATAFGRRFRVYTFVSLALMLLFGALTAVDGPRVAANLPTPWIGLYERVNIAGWLLWIAALAIGLLRAERAPHRPEWIAAHGART